MRQAAMMFRAILRAASAWLVAAQLALSPAMADGINNPSPTQSAPNAVSGNPTGATANRQDIPLPSGGCSGATSALTWTPGSPGIIGCNNALGPVVSSVFGRTGAVTPTAGDYTAAKIGSTGAYYRTKIVSFCASGCTFTSGPYTPDTGLVYDDITCVGGGAAGGGVVGSATGERSAGGGSAGVASRVWASAATVGASQTVTLGAAGSGSSGATGGAGGTTSLGSICSANGGNGGVLNDSSTGFGFGGASPTTGTGDVVTPGQAGGYGSSASITTVTALGGMGGSGPFGAGGSEQNGTAAGTAGTGYGSGGGGASVAATATSNAGGNGTPGKIVIVEYLNQ